ncbi:WD40 repeat-containing protein [Heterostelium album PN500]|uniref:WD40 repeat-containing protein n=1 Tax=Heterostelium pallidum (strain ATCC 26659 / Pp 5 / PN500) TaxID=670386 RepID=D3B6P1_HETP5|nr:WD40 repeat-containing protein [Heterostelium album PN500]EFA83011.1 WD40 repeat-containing protein [Heterostelium album PN500]|eukprot:XP_020435128.1 WD40 repeat-containing protein [Heterostelium album PN500]
MINFKRVSFTMTNNQIIKNQSVDFISYSPSDRYIGVALSNLTGSYWNGQITILNTETPLSSSLEYNTNSGNTCLRWLSDDSLIFSSDSGAISLLKIDDTSLQILNYLSTTTTTNSSNDNDSNNKNKPPVPKKRRDNIIEILLNCAHDNIISSIDVNHHDSNRLLTASNDRTIKLWDIENRCKSMQFNVHTSEVNAIQWSPKDADLFVSSSTGRVVLSDSRSKSSFTTVKLTNHRHADIPVRSINWNTDNIVWCGMDNGDLLSIDTRNNCYTQSTIKQHHRATINQIKFNPFNNDQLSTVSDDRTYKIYNLSTKQTVTSTIESNINQPNYIKSIDWNKSIENQFITGSNNGIITINKL